MPLIGLEYSIPAPPAAESTTRAHRSGWLICMVTTRKKTRTHKRKQPAKTPPIPTPNPGERIFLVHLPFGVKFPDTTYRKDLKRHIYIGATLPEDLRPYAAQPYSYEAWVQDQLNGDATPTLRGAAAPMSPRHTQVEDATAIVSAAAAGWRGTYIGSGVGTGKTITCILAAKAICHLRKGSTVLVTVDRPYRMTAPMWRKNIAAVGDGGLRWIIVSSDGGLKQLIGPSGRPRINPDVIIADEAHQFRRDSQRTSRMRRITRLDNQPGASTPFVMSVTATPGHCPTEYLYLSSLLAQIHNESPQQWTDLGKRLEQAGLPVAKNYGTWGWNEQAINSPALRDDATATVRDWMLHTTPPVMINRQASWGPAHLDGIPVELTPEQRRLYLAEWGDYQREMNLARHGNDTARGLAALTRFRQKASHIRIESTVDRTVADLEDGYQVLLAVEHVSTAAQPLADALAQKGIPVAHLYGGRQDVEEERLRFQRGHARVAVINTVSSVSLHAGEQLADGTCATLAPRRGYFHQPRYSGIAAQQMMGRAHRDGQVCNWALLFSENTIEQEAAERMVSRLSSIATSVDADRSSLAGIAALFGADWLPTDRALDG